MFSNVSFQTFQNSNTFFHKIRNSPRPYVAGFIFLDLGKVFAVSLLVTLGSPLIRVAQWMDKLPFRKCLHPIVCCVVYARVSVEEAFGSSACKGGASIPLNQDWSPDIMHFLIAGGVPVFVKYFPRSVINLSFTTNR